MIGLSSSYIKISENENEEQTVYQGARTETDCYYDPNLIPVGRRPIADCQLDRTSMGENLPIINGNANSRSGISLLGDCSGLVPNELSTNGITNATANPTFGTYFGSFGSTSRHSHGHKPIVFGDPNSGACLVNKQFHYGRPNLFS